MRVSREWRKVRGQARGDVDVLRPELVRQELDRFADDLIEDDGGAFGWPLPREGEKIADNPYAATGCGVDLFRAGGHGDAGGALPEQMCLSHHHGQRIVQLMGDAGKQ